MQVEQCVCMYVYAHIYIFKEQLFFLNQTLHQPTQV